MSRANKTKMPKYKHYEDKAEVWYFLTLISLVTLLPLFYTPWTFEIFAIAKVTLLRIVGAVLLIVFSLEIAWKRQIVPRWIHLLVLVFLLETAISTFISIHPPTSLLGLRKRYFGLITQISLFGIYLATTRISWNKKQIRQFLLANVATALIISLIGITQSFGFNFPIDLHKYFANHAYSTFGNPNFLGAYLIIIIPLAIGLLSYSAIPTDRWLAGFSVTASIIAVILTKSSGAMVALVTSAIFFSCLYFLPGKFNIKPRRALSVFVVIVITLSVLGGYLIIKSESRSWQSRIRGWKAVSKIATKNWSFGVGPDAVRFASPHFLEPLHGYNEEIFEDGHNLFITTASTLGLPALGIFILIISMTFYQAINFIGDKNTDFRIKVVLLACLSSLIGYLTAEMVNPDFVVSAAFFWILIGLTVALSTTKLIQKKLKDIVVYLIAGVAITICITTITLSIGSYMAEFYLLKAESSPKLSANYHYYKLAQNYNPFYDMYSIRVAERLLNSVGTGISYIDNLALRSAKEAIKKSPKEGDNYIVMANIYRRLAKRDNAKAKLETAAAYCQKSLQENPYQKYALQHLTEILNQLGRKRQALKIANRYLNLFDSREVEQLRNSLKSQLN